MRRVAWLLVVARIGTTVDAHAQTATESVVTEGIGLRREGRDAEALAVFERALAVDGSPRTRAQVALAEEALGLWVEAERELSAALSAGDDPWFRQHRGTLQTALDAIRGRLTTLNVESNVAEAELWINGSAAGTMPLRSPLRVVAGTITLEVRAAGFETQTRTVHVAPQTRARELMELTKAPAPLSPPAASATLIAAPAEPPRTVTQGDIPRPDDAGSAMRTAAWLSLGGAVAFMAGASAALLVRNTNAATYNDDTRCFYGGQTRDARCGSYRDSASIAQTLAIVQVQIAAAAAGLSIVLFTKAPRNRGLRASAVRCTIGVSFSCGGSF
jgi:PEGA domain-containing protein